jgi:hypothetical protein
MPGRSDAARPQGDCYGFSRSPPPRAARQEAAARAGAHAETTAMTSRSAPASAGIVLVTVASALRTNVSNSSPLTISLPSRTRRR